MSILIDSYSESNYSGAFATEGNFVWGQSFEAGEPTLHLTSVWFYISKDAGSTGDLNALLYKHSGTYGTSSVGTGSPLAISDTVAISSIDTPYELVNFTFSGDQRVVLSDTYYIIALRRTGGGTGWVDMAHDSTAPTHGGNICSLSGSWSYNTSYDRIFYVYGEEIREVSGISSIQGISSITL